MRSAKAIEFPEVAGLRKLVNLTGGILAWADKGRSGDDQVIEAIVA